MTDRLLDRDKKWFDRNFLRYYQALCHFALNYLKDYAAVEDVVQSVFICLLDKEEKFESEEHLKHFLYKAVRNACLNEIKLKDLHAGILEKVTRKQNLEEQEEDFFVQVVRTEIYRQIQEALEELPAGCERIFRMAYLEHLGNSEIAEKLNISVNTVKVQKNKAKHLLQKKLKGLYPLLFLLASF